MQSVASINHDVVINQQERRGAVNETMGRVLNRLLGCWQHKLSRPFSNKGRTYRICVKCGMSRDFDPNSWKTHGHYQVSGPNVSYPKTQSCGSVLKNQDPSHFTPSTTSHRSKRVSSLGSVKQGQFGTNCEAGFAA
jgi:hypothetical protein